MFVIVRGPFCGRAAAPRPNPTLNSPPWAQDHLIPGTSCLTNTAVGDSCQDAAAARFREAES